ncbi:toxin glutamine deamidase domain-containing protein [Nocardia vaccinii]|uniref:toxin glutamine deamidase domain-containing protein n=1 Tax=Nocardia vaccinii TaxID=1822 RepID=UPI0027D8393F|nr:toxin glutamine deamidase domain-containing protein [Nocardia vaccinii]
MSGPGAHGLSSARHPNLQAPDNQNIVLGTRSGEPTGHSTTLRSRTDAILPTTETAPAAFASETESVPEHPYARALGAALTGDRPIDFARVLTILNSAHSAPEVLDNAFAATSGRPLRDVVREAVQQGRLSASQERRMARLMGWQPKQDLPAGVSVPRTAARPGQSPADLPAVREYVKSLLSVDDTDGALAFIENLNRNPRKLWAVQDAYRNETGGRDLVTDLRNGLPEEKEYLDHVFAESPQRHSLWGSDDERVPVEWDTAREWFAHIDTMTFEHWSGDHPMPHGYLDTGCVQLAHHVALELISLGTQPRKILVNGEDLRMNQILPDGTAKLLDSHAMALAPGRLLPPRTENEVHRPESLRELDRALADADTDERLLQSLNIMARRKLGGQIRDAVQDYLRTHQAEGAPAVESDILAIIDARLAGNPARVGLIDDNPALARFLQSHLPTEFHSFIVGNRDTDSDHEYAAQLATALQGDGPIAFPAMLDTLRHAAVQRDPAFLEGAYQIAHHIPLAAAVRQAHETGRLSDGQASRVRHLMGWEPATIPASALPASVSRENTPAVRAYTDAIRDRIDSGQPLAALTMIMQLDRDPHALWPVQSAYRTATGGRELFDDLRTALPDEHDYIDHAFARPPAAISASDADPAPVLEDTATDWIRALGELPFTTEVGSIERAHLTASALIRQGTYPRKLVITAEGMRAPTTVPDALRRNVSSQQSVPISQYTANLVHTVEGGIAAWQVFDPALSRSPMLIQEVLTHLQAPHDARIHEFTVPETLAELEQQVTSDWETKRDNELGGQPTAGTARPGPARPVFPALDTDPAIAPPSSTAPGAPATDTYISEPQASATSVTEQQLPQPVSQSASGSNSPAHGLSEDREAVLEQARERRAMLKAATPVGPTTPVAANPRSATASFDHLRYEHAGGEDLVAPVAVARIVMHTSLGPGVTPDQALQFWQRAHLATDSEFGRGEILEPMQLLHVDLVPTQSTADIASAHLNITIGHGHGQWHPDMSVESFTENLREHLGLPRPSNPDGLSADDLRHLGNAMARALTASRLTGLGGTRHFGLNYLQPLEDPGFQHEVEDALRDGDRFLVGADPRDNDYGTLVNAGGTSEPGRNNNCLDTSLAGLASFMGDPQVALPRWLDNRWGEAGGMQRAQNFLGTPIQSFNSAGSMDRQFAALHESIEQQGPGSAALVHNIWQKQDPITKQPLFYSNGFPVLSDISHATVVVYPTTVAPNRTPGPVWWDPQSGVTSDHPPAWLVDRSAHMEYLLVPRPTTTPAGPTS